MEIGIKLGTIIAAMINFLILLFIAKHFLFIPVNKILETRKQELVSSFKEADKDKEEARRLKAESDEKLKLAQKEGKNIVEMYKLRAEKISGELIKEAKQEALLIIERSRIETERQKQKVENEVKKQVIELSLILSERALEQHINKEEHKKLIEDFISEIGTPNV